MVDVRHVRSFAHVISLAELKTHAALRSMRLLQRGNRLSIMPVSEQEWRYILKIESAFA